MSLEPDPAITGLSDEERELLVEALCALRYVRGREWLAASASAVDRGKRRPGFERLQVAEMKRLARRLGGQAAHWMER